MGCCLSHPQGPDAPYADGGAASASERAITAPSVGGRSSFVSGPAPGPVSVPPAPAAAASATAGSTAHADAAHSNSDSDATMASSLSVAAAAARRQPRDAHLLAVIPSSSSPSAPVSQQQQQQQQQPELAQHLNKPLRPPLGWSCNRRWSRQAIDRERIDFFDTRVTGRIEIWQTLRVVLELQWEVQRRGCDWHDTASIVAAAAAAEEARATAQTILDAAAITLPTGDLTRGAYDVFGNFYDLPMWIVSDPSGMVEEEEDNGDDDDDDDDDEGGDGDDEGEDSDPKSALDEQQQRRRSHGGDDAGAADNSDGSDTLSSDGEDNDEDDADGDASRRREEKGKAVLTVDDPPRHHRPPTITLRARLSLNGRDVVLRVPRDASVRSIAHQVAARAQLPPPDAATHRVRLAYMGRLLKEGQSLPAQGWQEGHVLNALVFGVAE